MSLITDPDHVTTVCKIGQKEACCSFLMFGDGPECAKGTGYEAIIRQRLADGTFGSLGDNCEGWPT